MENNVEGRLFERFVYEVDFRDKVLEKLRKKAQDNHACEIKSLKNESGELLKRRAQKLKDLENSRWEVVVKDAFRICKDKGCVEINGTEIPFTDIKGAEINIVGGERVRSSDYTNSRPRASVGGALAGGLIAGPVGAVVGGVGLRRTNSFNTYNSNYIPTCRHMGVVVYLDGFATEIIIFTNESDIGSRRYEEANKKANEVIIKLHTVTKLPIPETYIPSDQFEVIKNFDLLIENKEKEIQEKISSKPKLVIPEKYKSSKYSNMTDEEYLEYIESNYRTIIKEREEKEKAEREAKTLEDAKQQNKLEQERLEKIANKNAIKEEKLKRKEQSQLEKLNKLKIQNQIKEEENKARKLKKEEKIELNSKPKDNKEPIAKPKNGNTSLPIVCKTIFWILSLFVAIILAVPNLSVAGNILCGFLLLIVAILINPLLEKVVKIPVWLKVVILVVGFFIFVFV